jgi:3-hydroxyisobutyrate dehydrogenase-like beta-hydroxyacid dehydrogenase
MTHDTRVCLIGFGEVGQTLADDLARAGVADIVVWDVLFADGASIPSKALPRSKVRAASDAPSAVRDAHLVISAVTAAQDSNAARAVASGLQRGTFYLDLNSVSPEMKQDVARIVDATGAHYVEGAVMSPIGPKRIASPILLGGPHADDFLQLGKALGFSGASVFARDVGKASAAKMCRSVMVKGIEALLTESLLAARRHGVEDTVLASLKDLFPGADWRKLAQYMISRSLLHGKRRAEEMREVAQTVANAGLTPHMSAACAERQEWAAQFRAAAAAGSLESMLDSIVTKVPPSCPSAGHGARVLQAQGSAGAAPATAGQGTQGCSGGSASDESLTAIR